MDDLDICLRLSFTKGIGPVSAKKILRHYPTTGAIQRASRHELCKAGLSEAQTDAFLADGHDEKISAALRWAEQTNHHLIPLGSKRYPPRLAEIHDAPTLLYAVGDADVLHTPQLAVVGSRKPSSGGARTASEFAASIATSGITITSGMALGIDGLAHRGCLDADGLTIGVAATGLDRIYPAKHKALAQRIVENGVMLSEYPLGTDVRGPYFTHRNRIISGLSIGTLVVEAAIRSGSLSTARHASEQGREVFAIPGSIHNPMARGCHKLIRQGAKLVETVDDILEELAGQIGPLNFPDLAESETGKETFKQELDPDYQNLLECLDYSPRTVDQIVERSDMNVRDVASMLLILEMKGLIATSGTNRYVRC